MDFKSLATQLLMDKLGSSGETSIAEKAITALVGNGANFDLGDMVSQFTSGDSSIADKAKSWLGNGENESISANQVQDILGSDKISSFAAQLGIGKEEASNKLTSLIPKLIDQGSRNGNLLDAIGGSEILSKFTSKLFK